MQKKPQLFGFHPTTAVKSVSVCVPRMSPKLYQYSNACRDLAAFFSPKNGNTVHLSMPKVYVVPVSYLLVVKNKLLF